MEDSYMVHRRRKAAARRREKTPEPSSKNQLVESTDDEEEEARRAKMEKMADDAEQEELEKKTAGQGDPEEKMLSPKKPERRRSANMEEVKRSSDNEKKKVEEAKRSRSDSEMKQKLEEAKRSRSDSEMKQKLEKAKRSMSDSEKKKLEEAKRSISDSEKKTVILNNVPARENGAEEMTASVRKEVMTQPDEAGVEKEASEHSEAPTKEKDQDFSPGSEESDGESDTDPQTEPRRVERRLKKKSRERVERPGEASDSSDTDENIDKHSRRSPDGKKIRVKKPSSKKVNSVDPEVAKKYTVERPPREKKSSKQKLQETEGEPKPEGGPTQKNDSNVDKALWEGVVPPSQTKEEVVKKRSPSNVKKQIIPLSNDSLIEDFAKAQWEQQKREQSILAPEKPAANRNVQEQKCLLRSRKEKVVEPIKESEEVKKKDKKSWLSWLSFFNRDDSDMSDIELTWKKPKPPQQTQTESVNVEEARRWRKVLQSFKYLVSEFKVFVEQNPREAQTLRNLKNRCLSELVLMIIYCGLGAFLFRFIEGAFENFYKCGVKRVKRDFLDTLWTYSHNKNEEEWKSLARRKLMEFEEQLHTAHEAGVQTYSGQSSWSFLNSVLYCLTVITTIGYGHISPTTTTGRAITIVYAIFGIPMFLIILADFGKLFTRGIKFLWAFVRRLYYTGSCRKVRRTVPVLEVMKGVQMVYDLATFKRPSQINPEDIQEIQKQAQQSQAVLNLDGNVPDTPGTPAMSTFAVDDEFNLPISVAIFILLVYIFVGATLFCFSEGWGFFESFYFVFISMSTIGFGDYVPKHPIYMMCSIIYLVFGLALTSMCINVVQVMLSDSFKQASQKIGATIGFEIAEEDGSVNPAMPPPVEIADVHLNEKSGSEEKIAPRAKQEDVEL